MTDNRSKTEQNVKDRNLNRLMHFFPESKVSAGIAGCIIILVYDMTVYIALYYFIC